MPQTTEEVRLALIKRAISTTEGWRNLAISVRESSNPDAKQECIEVLRQIGSDKMVSVPTEQGIVSVNFADLLVSQLEQNIALYEVTKKEE